MNEEFNLSQWDGKFGDKRLLPEGNLDPSDYVPHIIDSALRKYDELNPHRRPDEERLIHQMLDALYLQRAQVDLLEIQHGDIVKSKLSTVNDPYERIRIFGGKIKIGSDVDKTITATDSYLNQIPGSVLAENYMAHPEHGREVMPRVHARYWKEGMAHEWGRNHTKKVGTNAPFRPGVVEFFEALREQGIPTTLISANFRPFIDGISERIPQGAVQKIWCTDSEDIRATDKGTVIKKEVFDNPDRAFIFIGDGLSDIPATMASDYVAIYFALEGGGFARHLQEKNLVHFTYKDFRDIHNKLRELDCMI